jgi:DNA-directed RNA polymerase specialized sigma24 family protein
MKRCSHCKQVKPLDEFPSNRSRPDGKHVHCFDCTRERRRMFVSLDAEVRGPYGKTVRRADIVITKPLREPTDSTWEKVMLAMRYWLDDKTLDIKQVDAILMHAVEGLPFTEIAELVGMHHTTVMYQYQKGIERLRQRYGGAIEDESSKAV